VLFVCQSNTLIRTFKKNYVAVCVCVCVCVCVRARANVSASGDVLWILAVCVTVCVCMCSNSVCTCQYTILTACFRPSFFVCYMKYYF